MDGERLRLEGVVDSTLLGDAAENDGNACRLGGPRGELMFSDVACEKSTKEPSMGPEMLNCVRVGRDL